MYLCLWADRVGEDIHNERPSQQQVRLKKLFESVLSIRLFSFWFHLSRGVNTRALDELFTRSQARADEWNDVIMVLLLFWINERESANVAHWHCVYVTGEHTRSLQREYQGSAGAEWRRRKVIFLFYDFVVAGKG